MAWAVLDRIAMDVVDAVLDGCSQPLRRYDSFRSITIANPFLPISGRHPCTCFALAGRRPVAHEDIDVRQCHPAVVVVGAEEVHAALE